MKKWILKTFLLGAWVSAFAPALSGANEPETGIKSWDGVRLVSLGTNYLLNVPRDAVDWIKQPENSFIPTVTGDDAVKMSASLISGLKNAGKIMVIAGIAKEYQALFNFKDDPDNMLNSLSADKLALFQKSRLETIQGYLLDLNDGLQTQKIEAEWLTHFFDPGTDKVSQDSLQSGISTFGSLLNKFYIYGVGIEIVSDIPVGAIATAVLSKWIPGSVQKYSDGLSYQQMQGMLYFTKPTSHKNDWAISNFGQGGARAQLSALTRGQSHNTAEVSFTVRVSLLASTKRLKKFDPINLNNTMISELTIKNNLMSSVPESMRGILKATKDALDKNNNYSFLQENVRMAYGHLHSFTDVDNNPQLLIRFSVGDYTKAMADKGFSGWIEPSAAFGKLSVEREKEK